MNKSRSTRPVYLEVAGQPRRIARMPVLLLFVLLLVGNASVRAQDYGPPLDPYEVIVYENADFVGDFLRFKLEPGMRQKLVPVLPGVWNDRISSFRVGEKVAVKLFEHADFGYGYVFTESTKVFDRCKDKGANLDVGHLNDAISSLIVFPKEIKEPLGVYLWNERSYVWFPGSTQNNGRFFPLPERLADTEARYGNLGSLDDDSNGFQLSHDHRGMPEFGKIEATFYADPNFGGRQLTIPGPDNKIYGGNFGDYQFSDTASSLIVRVRKPTAPIAEDEVIVYEHYNFMGMSRRFRLDPGMRQKFVNYVGDDLNDRVSSIQVGSKVGVATYDHADFGGDEPVYLETRSKLDNPHNDRMSSLIIFPKEMKQPLGIMLVDIGDSGGTGYFYPLPEKLNETVARYATIGEMNDDANSVHFLPSTSLSPASGKIGTTLYEHADFKGRWLTFPSADSGIPREGFVTLNHYSFDDAASSLEVRWLGPTMIVVSPAVVKVDVPNDVQPSVPGGGSQSSQERMNQDGSNKGVQKSVAPDISGQWNSSSGLVYTITQTSGQFAWKVAATGETGQGTILGQDISASWSGPAGSGLAKGKITAVDTYGKPTQIEWSNGVRFFR